MDGQRDYSIDVELAAEDCVWVVKRADQRALSGLAPDLHSAKRRGAFAAAALHGLDLVARRRF